MLYFQQIMVMLVSLYTVRVVLNTLGAEDYGLYNVVAGVVTMLGFLNSAMSSASLQYFSVGIGNDDSDQLKRIFTVNFIIYILLGLLIVLLSETIGLWFIKYKLTVPQMRMDAILWVYQVSIISFVFSIMSTPFRSIITAHEDLYLYARVAIIEVILKLGAVFLLRIILLDKLKLYALLLCFVTIIISIVYAIICLIKYKECRFISYWNIKLFKRIISYTGWNLLGGLIIIFKTQLMTILLNQFFNSVVAASRSIAMQVSTAINSVAYNFIVAMRPQIIKDYSGGQKEQMLNLVFLGEKVVFFLLYIFMLPLIIETPIILSIWLKEPPLYTVVFTRLMLLDVFVEALSYPLNSALMATEKLKLFMPITGGIIILNLPISWIGLYFGVPAYFVILVSICLKCIVLLCNLFFTRMFISLSIKKIFREFIIPASLVTILSIVIPLFLHTILQQNLTRLFIVIIISMFSVCIFVYFILLNNMERKQITRFILNKIHKAEVIIV